MYFYKGAVYVEDEDECINCNNFVQGVTCPLLNALGMNIVTLNENIYVTNCGFYNEFKRHLKILKNKDD